MSNPPVTGFYGLGSMGLPMASNLHRYLQSVGSGLYVSNRTQAKAQTLLDNGAMWKDSISKLALSCDIVFIMVSTDTVLMSLVDQLLSDGGDLNGKTFVDCSTVHPDTSYAVSSKFTAAGAHFIAAPVFGSSPVAAAGKLIFSMGGPTEQTRIVGPLIEKSMGRKIIGFGEDVKAAAMLKITNNILLVSFLEVIAEVQVLAELNGVGTAQMESLINDNFGPTLGSYSRRMTSGSWAPPKGIAPGFAVSNSIKDARHALRVANGLDVRCPTLEIGLSNMLSARAYGGEDIDAASMYGVLRAQAGLDFWSHDSRQE